MKDIKVGVEKMTRNRRKMIEKTADSLLLSKHSIQFSALFLLISVCSRYTQNQPWDLKLEVLVKRIEKVFLDSATLKLFLQFEDVLLM